MTARLTAIILLLLGSPLLAQTQPQPQPAPEQEVPPHDITGVDEAPIGGAIALPLPEAQRRKLEKYDIPELVGARQAIGPQLIDGQLRKPIVDYIAREGAVLQRLSMFERGLVVVNVTGAGATIRKKLIIPADAVANYLKVINSKSLDAVRQDQLPIPRPDRKSTLRVYEAKGYVERSFDPLAVLPKPMNDQLLPLQDLLRAIYEDRGVTNTIAGYVPKIGDQLVGDDRKVFKVVRIIDKRIVELRCISQPTTIYVAIKDLYNYFIGTTGVARQ